VSVPTAGCTDSAWATSGRLPPIPKNDITPARTWCRPSTSITTRQIPLSFSILHHHGNRVLKLDELAARIATHLLAISRRSTVSLALTCRALEVPALMALWETECSLTSLIKRVLPMNAWCIVVQRHSDLGLLVSLLFSSGQNPAHSPTRNSQQALQRPLNTREMNRLKLYASWIRRLEVRERVLSDEVARLVLPPTRRNPSRPASSLAGVDLASQRNQHIIPPKTPLTIFDNDCHHHE